MPRPPSCPGASPGNPEATADPWSTSRWTAATVPEAAAGVSRGRGAPERRWWRSRWQRPARRRRVRRNGGWCAGRAIRRRPRRAAPLPRPAMAGMAPRRAHHPGAPAPSRGTQSALRYRRPARPARPAVPAAPRAGRRSPVPRPPPATGRPRGAPRTRSPAAPAPAPRREGARGPVPHHLQRTLGPAGTAQPVRGVRQPVVIARARTDRHTRATVISASSRPRSPRNSGPSQSVPNPTSIGSRTPRTAPGPASAWLRGWRLLRQTAPYRPPRMDYRLVAPSCRGGRTR